VMAMHCHYFARYPVHELPHPRHLSSSSESTSI
jgi:hypothetical protein